jgi:hypothetical protein
MAAAGGNVPCLKKKSTLKEKMSYNLGKAEFQREKERSLWQR